jgi:hypothetical protein
MEFLATDPEVLGSISGTSRFSGLSKTVYGRLFQKYWVAVVSISRIYNRKKHHNLVTFCCKRKILFHFSPLSKLQLFSKLECLKFCKRYQRPVTFQV